MDRIISQWNNLSAKAIQSALERLNRVSNGEWKFDEIFTLNEIQNNYDAICVYFDVKMEGELLNFALFFNKKDIAGLLKCFTGRSFLASDSITMKEELLIAELGNIILNSLISTLCNKLNTSLIPSVPKVIQVEKEMGLEIIAKDLPSTRKKLMFGNMINLKCGAENILWEIYSFLPVNIINAIQD